MHCKMILTFAILAGNWIYLVMSILVMGSDNRDIENKSDKSECCRTFGYHELTFAFQASGEWSRMERSGGSGVRQNAFLRREMIRNASAACNDGTAAGYYIRSNPSSKRWLVFLEGGWHCFSHLSCQQRWIRSRFLMTSAHWPQIRSSKWLSFHHFNHCPNCDLTLINLLFLQWVGYCPRIQRRTHTGLMRISSSFPTAPLTPGPAT